MIRPQLEKFMQQIGENAIAIIPAAREVVRSYDTEHKFRQDSDFYYLTGFPEPDAIAVLMPSHTETPFVLFVRPRDAEKETWNGRRFGLDGAVGGFGAQKAFDIADFAKEIPQMLNGKERLYFRFGAHDEIDQTLLRNFHEFNIRRRKGFYAPPVIIDPASILHDARVVKTAEEIEIMRAAADLAVEAHTAAMCAVKPGMMEYELEALIEYTFKKRGASGVSYNSIVASGANACILHYIENSAEIKDGDLILIDAGAEFRGYASDITRCFPANGKFTDAQRDIYNAVLRTEEACLKATVAGVTIKERQDLSIRLLTEEMLTLGILHGDADKIIEEKGYEKFYMHGVGHYLGLDVHDAGRYFVDSKSEKSHPFAAGMVLTVEPGLYIPPNADNVPDKYRGIGVRIEDDVLITADGNENLTVKCPKQIEEIEDLMAQR